MAHHRRAELLSDRAALRTRMAAWRESHQIVALVPTMGALHEGHLSLVRLVAARADRLLVSIFVNPAQFTPSEDFSAYPRTLEADREKLGTAVDAIYCPPVADIYPADFVTSISLEGPATTGLEDRFRPTHFKGVATVVAKLFLQTTPHLAVFGEKDFQQLCVIRQMVRDLELPVNVVAAPTIREVDGLAMSSRNVYLSEAERAVAPLIYHTLTQCAERLRQGDEANLVLAEGVAILEKSGFSVDYLEWRQADTLLPATTIEQPTRVLVAARIGATRLIDNIAV